MKTQLTSLTLLAALFTGTATAGNVTIPNTFTSGTKAVAAQVNENFSAIKDAINALPDGSAIGDMQYWDGTTWVLLDAPTAPTATLRFCGGQPSWECIAVGDTGPAGGTVILVNADGVTGLEAAPADLVSTSAWGCDGNLTGVNDPSIGSGATNTNTLVTVHGCTAALAASNFISGGESDWFLPSKDELNLLYNQRAIIGGFTTGLYWSSTENGTNGSFFQDFSDGSQDFTGKTQIHNIRPVRAF